MPYVKEYKVAVLINVAKGTGKNGHPYQPQKSRKYLSDGGVASGHEERDGVLEEEILVAPLAEVAEELELLALVVGLERLEGVHDELLQRLVGHVPPLPVRQHLNGMVIRDQEANKLSQNK